MSAMKHQTQKEKDQPNSKKIILFPFIKQALFITKNLMSAIKKVLDKVDRFGSSLRRMHGWDNIWSATLTDINVLAYMNTTENLPDYSDQISNIKDAQNIRKQGLWTWFNFARDGIVYNLAVYRKRLVINLNMPIGDTDKLLSLSEMIELGLEKVQIMRIICTEIASTICRKALIDVRTFPLLSCEKFRLRKSKERFSTKEPKWIDDGLSTFYVRVYDSKKNRIGYIRVSRHLAICFSLSRRMKQDIVNLIHECFLYKPGEVYADQVFSLFDSLGKYVLPLEFNLFIQKAFYKLAIFGIVAALLISLTQAIGGIIGQQIKPGEATFDLWILTLSFKQLYAILNAFILHLLAGFSFFILWRIISFFHAKLSKW